MAGIHPIYLEWCTLFGKDVDEYRFKVFLSNFLIMEFHALETGESLELNQWFDCTEQECRDYIQRRDTPSSSVLLTQTDIDESTSVDACLVDMLEGASTQIRYKCSEEEYHAITHGKAVLKVIENIETVLDAEYADLSHTSTSRPRNENVKAGQRSTFEPLWDSPGTWKKGGSHSKSEGRRRPSWS